MLLILLYLLKLFHYICQYIIQQGFSSSHVNINFEIEEMGAGLFSPICPFGPSPIFRLGAEWTFFPRGRRGWGRINLEPYLVDNFSDLSVRKVQ